jgi:hypothetical protein
MGYALMWVESLTAALLLQALVTACAARWRRFTRTFASIVMAIAILTLAVGVTLVVSFLRFAVFILSAPFPTVLTWTVGFAVGAVWVVRMGLKRHKDDGTPAARSWPRGRLALATAAALIVNGITFTNMDLAMKIHLSGVRAEAGAQILALAPPRVPDRDNAAPVYLEAISALTPSAKLPAAWREKEEDWLSLDKSQWKPSDKDVADFLASQEIGLSLLRQASAMAACSFDRDIALSRNLPVPDWNLARCAQLLALDAVVKASRGDAKGATSDIAAIHGITRHLADPFLLSVLVAAAIEKTGAKALEEVLALVRLDADNLDRLAQGQGVSYRERMRRAFRMGEVAFGLSYFAMAAGEDSDSLPAELKTEVDGMFKLFPRAVWRVFFMQDDLSAYRRRMREAEALMAKPYYEARDGWEAFDRSFRANRGGLLTWRILPASERIALPMTEADAARQLARLALAATAFKNKTGQYPAQLEDLVPAYLSQVPTDPFDGKPLRMKRVAEGLLLYSVGPDMKDNGGQVYNAAERTGDIVFRLH